MPDVRRCLHPDRERALATVVAAFRTDPLLRWVWPEDERYDECAPGFFGLLIDLRLAAGEVWVADDGDAVAMWNPPGGAYVPDPPDAWPALHDRFTDVERKRWEIFDSALAVPRDAGPHWYLGVLATIPARQGEGLGRAVAAPMMINADRVGLPVYLETMTERNLGFYRRQGFEVVIETDLPDGPRCWLMRRPPGRPR